MFLGNYYAFIDRKWRFYLPLAFRLMFGADPDSDRIFKMAENGHLEMYPFYDEHAGHIRASKKNKRTFVRITIPEAFRRNGSLMPDHSVAAIGMGNYIEVMPLLSARGGSNETAKI